MSYSKQDLWKRYQKYCTEFPNLDLSLDVSRMSFPESFISSMQPRLKKALAAMARLEKGAVANPDEKRMVGHYWLRNAALAPTPAIAREIKSTVSGIKAFAKRVHEGKLKGAKGAFENVLLIGIGGSALGPQFVANALGNPAQDKLKVFFFDNTDPDGIDKVIASIGSSLGKTLSVVVSKSGGTKETRNGMLEAEAAYKKAGLDFGRHAVAVTSAGSQLDKYAVERQWLARFPMWDWVGGRTSELSAVGLLPAALQGLDIDGMLAGARACDDLTRQSAFKTNPAAQLALMWYYAGNGKGQKNMVVLPYKDRLELFSKYLQQLIMESLGKRLDLDGKEVYQGITVLGNKGSTDQHSYIQQLRDGLDNFFVTFIRVLSDRAQKSIEVEPKVTTGDYLEGFLQGTRSALFESGRESITITIREVSPFAIGALIALFERTVGLYAVLINVNAYHQPGVEAGKKAASAVIELQLGILDFLKQNSGKLFSASDLANRLGKPEEVEAIFHICEHLAANPRGLKQVSAKSPAETRFRIA